MWRQSAIYGLALAAGTLLLQWIDYQRMVRVDAGGIILFLVAAAFLVLGVLIGVRLIGGAPVPFDGNPAAVAQLGISPRELEVLAALAAGRSNKEIALALGSSPNTVKTQVASLYQKLGAARRTEAVNRARDLGIIR